MLGRQLEGGRASAMRMNSQDTLEVIRQVAAGVVAEIAPAEKSYFPVVWEEFLARGGGSVEAQKPSIIAGLFLDQPAALKLVSAMTLLVVSEVYAEMSHRFSPPDTKVVREATIDCAKRFGAPDRLAEALGERIPEKFKDAFESIVWGKKAEPMVCHEESVKNKPECVAWFYEGGKGRLQRKEGTRGELESHFSTQQKSSFNIFVNCWQKGIWVFRSEAHIPLEPRIQMTLVLLLLHRGKGIAPSRVVKWAWRDSSHVIGAPTKKVQENLKVVVSELKAKLKDVKTFEISEAQPDGSYICHGTCPFCVLLPGLMDEKLARLGLRPQV